MPSTARDTYGTAAEREAGYTGCGRTKVAGALPSRLSHIVSANPIVDELGRQAERPGPLDEGLNRTMLTHPRRGHWTKTPARR